MTPMMGTWILAAGLLSVSIPLIIHLLHRQKTTPLQWGAMMFLQESTLRMKRRKNIDYWILMAIRMAALALLAFMLARPEVKNKEFNAAATSPPSDIAVVLDRSMSMGRNTGDHTLFDEARSVVDKLTDGQSPILRGGDTLSVILAEHRPTVVTPLPVPMRDGKAITQLRDQLHQLKVGNTDCSIPVAVETAREVLRHGLNRRKVVVVASDEQESNWGTGENAAWERAVGDSATGFENHLEVFSYPLIPTDKSSNINVGRITVQPSLVGTGRPVQITSTISNSGPQDMASLTIHFSVNGQETAGAQVINNLGAGQSVTVRFDHQFTTPGSAWVRIWTDVVDAMAADNEAVAAVQVWQKLPVLVIDGQLSSAGSFKSSMFLTAAMLSDNIDRTITSLVQPKVVSISDMADVDLNDYYAVVLNDLPRIPLDLQGKLSDYVDSGHGLWVILGSKASPELIESLRGSSDGGHAGLFNAQMNAGERTEAIPPALELREPDNAMVKSITSAERNALSTAVTKTWWSITPKDPGTHVVLATAGGDPLILDRQKSEGRVVVWTTGADSEWNAWPAMPNFVPLVNETIYHLTTAQTASQTSGNVDAAAALYWSGPPTPAVHTIDITLPDGSVDAGHTPTARAGKLEFNYPNTFLPGLYQMRFTPTEVPQPIFYGVSIYDSELKTTTVTADEMEWLKKGKFLNPRKPQIAADQLSFIVTGVEEPAGFWAKHLAWMMDWKVLAGLVMLSLCAETFQTFRMTRLQKNVDVAGAGLLPQGMRA